MHSGRQIGDVLTREGNYRLAFPEDMDPPPPDSTIRLNGHWDESEMDEWSAELPTAALDSLHADLRAAQKETPFRPQRTRPIDSRTLRRQLKLCRRTLKSAAKRCKITAYGASRR